MPIVQAIVFYTILYCGILSMFSIVGFCPVGFLSCGILFRYRDIRLFLRPIPAHILSCFLSPGLLLLRIPAILTLLSSSVTKRPLLFFQSRRFTGVNVFFDDVRFDHLVQQTRSSISAFISAHRWRQHHCKMHTYFVIKVGVCLNFRMQQ